MKLNEIREKINDLRFKLDDAPENDIITINNTLYHLLGIVEKIAEQDQVPRCGKCKLRE